MYHKTGRRHFKPSFERLGLHYCCKSLPESLSDLTVLPERSRSMAQGHEINLSQTLLSSLVQGPAYRVKFKSQPAWLLKFSFKKPQPPYPILSQLEHSSLPPRPYHPPLASWSFLQIQFLLPSRPNSWPTRVGPFIERSGQFRARGSMMPKTAADLPKSTQPIKGCFKLFLLFLVNKSYFPPKTGNSWG